MFSHGVVILITATIDTGSYVDQSGRNNIEDRLNDYLVALRYWMMFHDRRISGIVFCENSGYPLCKLEKLRIHGSKKIIELLQFDGNVKPDGVHYGYSELGIIDYAISNSKLINNSKYFVKVTGRLMFPLVSELLDDLLNDVSVAIDFRKAYRNESGIRYRARTQIIVFEKDFYLKFLYGKRSEMIGHCSHIEEWMAEKLYPLKKRKGVYLRLPIECNSVGIAGSSSTSYSDISVQIKNKIRAIIRKYIPFWWL